MKQFFVSLIFILLGLQIFLSWQQFYNASWFSQNIKLNAQKDGTISLGSVYSHEPLIRIANYYDYSITNNGTKIYFGHGKQNSSSFLISNTWSWNLNDANYEYSLEVEHDQLTIHRKIDSNSRISKIGQSLFYCYDCIITLPNQKIAFYSQLNNLTKRTIDRAEKLGYQSFHVANNKLPGGIKQVVILNTLDNSKVLINTNQAELIINGDNNLLEVLTVPIIEENTYTANQIITVFNDYE